MSNVHHMVFKKLDCQNENDPTTDTLERRISAAGALSRLVRELRQDFGDDFAGKSLNNELYCIKMGAKP